VSVIRTGPLVVDLDRHEVAVNGAPVTINHYRAGTQRQWRLLACLARRIGQGVSYQTLATEVLGWPDDGRYERRNLREIRRRLVANLGTECDDLIRTVPGWGFRLEAL